MPDCNLPNLSLIIRPATFDDVDSLVELATSTFREAYRDLDDPVDIAEYVARAFTPAIFKSILEDDASTLLVALVGQRFIGYTHVKHSVPPPCVTGPSPVELSRLYLREEVLGKGHGAALMRTVMGEARRANCKTIWLGVYDRNEHAREFYKRWGFVDVGTKDFIFGGKAYADPVMSAPVRVDV